MYLTVRLFRRIGEQRDTFPGPAAMKVTCHLTRVL